MFDVVSFLNFLLAIIIFIKEVNAIRKTRFFSIKNACNVAFSVYLFLIPGVFYIYCPMDRARTLMLYDENGAFKSLFFSVICYLSFNIGYRTIRRNFRNLYKIRKVGAIKLSLVFALLSVASFYLWARSFGGINALILNAGAIRSGFVQPDIATAFFKHPVRLSELCSLYLFVVILTKRNSFKSIGEKITIYILEVVSVAISIVYLLADDSRSAMGLYFLSFMIAFLLKTTFVDGKNLGKSVLKAMLACSLILFAVLNGDVILGTLRGSIENEINVDSTRNGIGNSIVHNFAYIVQSPYYATYYIDHMNGKLLIWDDLITGLTAWLPTSLKPFPHMLRTWDVNTMVHTFHTPLYGQFPHSIVAGSIYDLSYFGLFSIPCILGILVKKVENVVIPMLKTPFYLSVYCFLLIAFTNMIQGFCLYYIMLSMFFLVLGWAIFLIMSKKSKNVS